MTSTRAINAAAGVIHAAMQQGKTIPTSIAYALDSAGLLNSPEAAAELLSLRARVAELETELRIGSPWKCGVCGKQNTRDVCVICETDRPELPEALHASSGAVIEVPARPEDVSRQVQQLRGLLARQREDAYRSPLHHDYRTPHDLPEPGVRP